MSKLIRIFLATAFVGSGLRAQSTGWQPSAGHTQIPIWPQDPPDALSVDEPETVTMNEKLVGGRPWLAVENVSQPTMTVYSPTGKNSGVAVLVFSGGGYKLLAIDLEGTEAADWLTSRGITCVLVKYRVPFSGPYMDEKAGRIYPKSPTALRDAQRALRVVRFHAAEWQIDPHKIGVLGFSAGGHMVAGMSTRFKETLYPAVDAADKESCRPDFAVAIFPGHLWANEDLDQPLTHGEAFEMRADIKVTPETSPTFLVQAENDDVDPIEESLAYYIALKRGGVPVEMHLYAEGGHAFGLRRTKLPITDWPELAETWLKTIGMLPAAL